MSLTLTMLNVRAAENSLAEIFALVTFSGTYPTGGDTIDFTTLYNQAGAEGVELDSDQLPILAEVLSQTGGWGSSLGGYYEVETYTRGATPAALTVKTCLLRAFQAGGTETSGTYASSQISQDRAILHAFFRRPQ